MGTIEEQLRTYIAENILFSDNGYPHGDDTPFLENGIVDSMSVMDLVLFAEKTYAIPIQDYEIVPANFDSISNLAGFIRSKMAPGS
ncbi:MAG: acyl carrier protein [Chloroflexi bacterium RBG_13_66_10]|jgi:acyl carrier protein|nr:MAG: acyl carrier protein [Chloroflexi bacterium RBG_13_66_10]